MEKDPYIPFKLSFLFYIYLYPSFSLTFTLLFLIVVLPGGTIQLATTTGNTSQGVGDGQNIPTLTMTNTPGGGAIVQYAQGQDGQFFVPGWWRPSFDLPWSLCPFFFLSTYNAN